MLNMLHYFDEVIQLGLLVSNIKELEDLVQDSRLIQRRFFENLWEICHKDIDVAIVHFNITRENAMLLSSLSLEQLKSFESFTVPLLQPKNGRNKDILNDVIKSLIEGNQDKLMLSFANFALQ